MTIEADLYSQADLFNILLVDEQDEPEYKLPIQPLPIEKWMVPMGKYCFSVNSFAKKFAWTPIVFITAFTSSLLKHIWDAVRDFFNGLILFFQPPTNSVGDIIENMVGCLSLSIAGPLIRLSLLPFLLSESVLITKTLLTSAEKLPNFQEMLFGSLTTSENRPIPPLPIEKWMTSMGEYCFSSDSLAKRSAWTPIFFITALASSLLGRIWDVVRDFFNGLIFLFQPPTNSVEDIIENTTSQPLFSIVGPLIRLSSLPHLLSESFVNTRTQFSNFPRKG